MNLKCIVLAGFVLTSAAVVVGAPIPATSTEAYDSQVTLPGSPFGVAWGFLYGYLDAKAEVFMPQVRRMGGGFSKVYLFWNQIEPQKGQYDWTAVDAFVGQLKTPDEGLIALFCSSRWATRQSAAILPPTPATNLDDYYQFVTTLVKHCRGKVRYWQNDAEPNNPIYWSGTKEEFVRQLKVFYKAVKDADPSAIVIVGGYDGLFGPPGFYQFPAQKAGLDFFDCVLKEGRDVFDVFDLRLYADPYSIVPRVEYMRQKMRALGYDKPIICTEYDGPGFYEFPANLKYVSLLSPWTQSVLQTGSNGFPSRDHSGSNQIAKLYTEINSLAPETQMFLLRCSPELEAKHDRIQARDLVMRNIFAFSAGVQKTLYWQLLDLRKNPNDLTTLMYGKIGLLGYENGLLQKRFPTADAYQRMTTALGGVRSVKRVEIPSRPSIYLFAVERRDRGPLYVVWERRDAFTGEDLPPVPFDFASAAAAATATDALGKDVPVQVANGKIHLAVSLTPIFIELSR
ncbi:MAG: hypothetical protein ABSA83_07470 [Verrucomicrobiota bacterium]|jgi:hypothetical protein